MTGILRPVTALLMAAAILLMGNGLLGVLLPLRADAENFSQLQIGLQGSAYYAGLTAGCILCPSLIARVGHIRSFVALTAVVTVTPLLHAMFPEPWAWWVLRAINGVCFAGLFMGIESWLTGAADVDTRGRVLAAYTIINLTLVTAGMQLSGIYGVRSYEAFSLVAILYSLAAVPVALTRASAPLPPRAPKLRLVWLVGVSPAAAFGCFFAGLANSAFWTLGPLFAKFAGLGVGEVATFLTVGVLGGALSQWPAGYLSDRMGRRVLISIAAALGLAASLGLAFGPGTSQMMVLVLVGFYGAAAFPIYPLCVAHANDLVHKKRNVEVSSGLLLMFSAGAVLGPMSASLLMSGAGSGGLFLHSAVAFAAIGALMMLRGSLRPHPPRRRDSEFVLVPRTTPAVFELDPRSDESMVSATSAAANATGEPPPAPDSGGAALDDGDGDGASKR